MRRRILVVDDEPLARQKIVRLLRECDGEFVIEEAEDGPQALSKIEAFKPDILILDIAMPGLSGFDVLMQCERRPFKVIFQTAYDQFAVKAFEENACDYLLKPYSDERFRAGIERALLATGDGDPLSNLESELIADHRYLAKIVVRQGPSQHVLAADDISCFVSRDHYTCLYTAGREFLTDLSLDHLQGRLDPSRFQRLHRGNIVRIGAVSALVTGRQYWVRTADGHVLPVSRANRRRIKEIFADRPELLHTAAEHDPD